MPSAPISETLRRERISARQRHSSVWRLIHALGSLRLALLLLATIAIACALATFAESRFDTKVAQAWIYKAPWFTVWLGLLCVNLFAVTLTRWPWQRKHLGFVITHYGIITLLIGAMLGSHYGFEGNVTLHRDAPPLDRVITSRTLLQVQNASSSETTAAPFDAQLARPTEDRPRDFIIPGTSWKIRADAHSENLIRTERLSPATPDAPPGISLDFSSKMMGQRITLPLLLSKTATPRDFFGLAQISFAATLPDLPPLRISESQIVFAKFAPITQGQDGATTGITAILSPDGATLTVTLTDGKSAVYERDRIAHQPQSLGAATLTVGDYWPDFALVDGRPASTSDRPNNPALLLRIEAPRRLESPARPRLDLAPAAGGVTYQLGRGDYALSRASASVGSVITLGWADWTATLAEALPHARVLTSWQPGSTGQAGIPGIRVRLLGPDGAASPPQWLAGGENLVLNAGPVVARVSYGLETRAIPFTIGLRNFEVPRLEGINTPANFIARVEFRDPLTGITKQDVAQMNHPASWPGTPFAVTTGLNYKFSQAQWNPDDLGETTLQVLYDPGWLLKWTGSLAICIGIFIMFYLRPKKS